MRWSEIHDDDVWEIPGSRSKNGKPHTVHLSALALEIIEAVRQIKGQDLLFSGNGKTPVSGFSSAKTRLDRHMLRALQEVHEDAQLAPWVLHDLRRTATTGMARIGIAPHVADRVLNHQAGTIRGVAAVYNRFEYLYERKAALQAWGRFVESFVRPAPSNNVVPLVAAV
jgi:integrase